MSDIILHKDVYEEIRIKDHTGKVLSAFSFNPSDADLVERYNEFSVEFEKLAKEIVEYETKNTGKKDIEKTNEQLKKINAVICKEMDKFLNADAAQNIFSVMGPLSPLPSGDYYFTFILEQILKKIENATGARMQIIDMKIKKHTEKYRK